MAMPLPVRMEQEPGSSGKALVDQYARYVVPGYDFRVYVQLAIS
jgi:phage terminase large subunit-like protein